MFQTTMTGSYYRTQEIEDLLRKSPTGELGSNYKDSIEKSESSAMDDQLHPEGNRTGLDWISNGEQRKSGYTTYIPNRFTGFSSSSRVSQQFSNEFYAELMEASPHLASMIQETKSFDLPVIQDRLQYTGEKIAKEEASQSLALARKKGAKRLFIPAPSPGVIAVFYSMGSAYHDHEDFIFSLSKELSREYRAILSVEGVDLQIDAPDLAMAKSLGVEWARNFKEVLPMHVRAINEAISGLPQDRIRVHYCYGNYASSHMTDPPYGEVLPELLKLKVGTLVGEMANPRHAGDPVIIKKHVKEHGWPKHMKIAAGVIDVKSPFVETPETVYQKLLNVADIDEIGPERTMGGTDCGFETFAGLGSVPRTIAVKKLKSLSIGSKLGQ